uniref:Uncharacterized protein n=1 Tax=Glossina brevipalpis TaxID=37001 RepID=A0A1A9WIE8_9MUSC
MAVRQSDDACAAVKFSIHFELWIGFHFDQPILTNKELLSSLVMVVVVVVVGMKKKRFRFIF